MYVCGITVYDYCHLGHARFLVVFDMVVKPTGDDVGTLLFMGAMLVLVGGYFIWRARTLEAVPAAAGTA